MYCWITKLMTFIYHSIFELFNLYIDLRRSDKTCFNYCGYKLKRLPKKYFLRQIEDISRSFTFIALCRAVFAKNGRSSCQLTRNEPISTDIHGNNLENGHYFLNVAHSPSLMIRNAHATMFQYVALQSLHSISGVSENCQLPPLPRLPPPDHPDSIVSIGWVE